MIYLEETLNLSPASPETLTSYVEFSQDLLVPACERLGTRIAIAWASNAEWYCQVTQITEFDSIDALKKFHINSGQDKNWGEYLAGLEEFAPERYIRLLEPLGPVSPEILNKKIIESQKTPKDGYFLAILQVSADNMAEFKSGLEQSHKFLPIVASWHPIAGNPNEVIDLWETSPEGLPSKYKPSDDNDKNFFGPLRKIAPKERIKPVYMLPYSQLL